MPRIEVRFNAGRWRCGDRAAAYRHKWTADNALAIDAVIDARISDDEHVVRW